jgi:hypothetical protein
MSPAEIQLEKGQSARKSRSLLALRLGLLGVILLTLSGCRTYQQQNKFAEPWHRGDLETAEKKVTAIAKKKAKGKDGIIWQLEQGAILRVRGKYEESNKAFELAEQRIDRYAEEAKVKLGSESAAMFSNQANLPYRGRGYDGIMLNTYRALNWLALNERDKARVEIIRAHQRQQDAVEENKRRIEKAQEDLEGEKERRRIQSAQEDPRVKDSLGKAYSNLDKLELEVYADYVNPFTVYLDGLLYWTQATGSSDLERARKSFERVVAFAPGNRFVQADLEAVEAATRGETEGRVTYVIFETGRAPVRDQVRIDIPIIFAQVSYVGAAFPTLTFQDDHLKSLTVQADGASQSTERVASMDAIIGSEFDRELPIIITKTIAAAVVKGAASYAANQVANQQGGDVIGLLSQITTAVYQLAVNIADLRTWTTLPKEFQVCRIPTPADNKVELLRPGTGQRVSVTLDEGLVNLIFVRSITAHGPMFVSQMILK